ncbi:MAG: hypothetical protein M0C28_40445 [Candidatus Moduliflexus flocculans]|nr:hypothetical protein [Candidatus Moduliflexus flocculans]
MTAAILDASFCLDRPGRVLQDQARPAALLHVRHEGPGGRHHPAPGPQAHPGLPDLRAPRGPRPGPLGGAQTHPGRHPPLRHQPDPLHVLDLRGRHRDRATTCSATTWSATGPGPPSASPSWSA